MPTEHKKEKVIKSKGDVKIEPNDIHPLGLYIDNKVELVRHVFECLKSKTIYSISPDFLQVSAQVFYYLLVVDENKTF